MGCFGDGIPVIVLITSIIMPMITAVGIGPLWFGIYLVIIVEIRQITPPVGFNLFGFRGLTDIDILRIAKAAFPFFLLISLDAVLITVFP
nr:TRAP transporter large permease subunit [Pacificibacter marinus]